MTELTDDDRAKVEGVAAAIAAADSDRKARLDNALKDRRKALAEVEDCKEALKEAKAYLEAATGFALGLAAEVCNPPKTIFDGAGDAPGQAAVEAD